MMPTRRAQIFEVSVFVFLILPSLVLGIIVTSPEAPSFGLAAVAAIVGDLSLVALIAYFLWRNSESAHQLGWVRRGAAKEVLLGVVLFIPVTAAITALDVALRSLGLPGPRETPPFMPPAGGLEMGLALVLVVVVAMSEETIFRGYLLLRLRAVTGNTTIAVLASSIIFGLGHGYEGISGMVSVGVMGLVFCLVYLWRKSLLAPVVMHFLQDVLAIIAVSALASPGR